MSDLVLNTFGLRRHPFTVDIDVDGLFAFQSFQQGASEWSNRLVRKAPF